MVCVVVVWLLCVLLLVYAVVSDAFDMIFSVARLCLFVVVSKFVC